MDAAATESFGNMLRAARLATGLTQEALAERAGVSSRSIQALERGENRPQQETARRLADALALDEPDRARLLRAVSPVPRRRVVAEDAMLPAEPALAPALSAPEAALADGMLTVLVTDIRGYTAFTHLHGDAAGAALASRFAMLAGEAIAAESGRVVEVRGDEVLAVFSSARAALRAATGLQARCAQEASAALPLRAGVGLDVGEPVAVAGGYRGEAINVAARLCAQAGPGEVLASEAVVHLARRVEGLAYQERGELALKGLPRPVRTWLVRAGAGELESIAAPAAGTTPVATVASATSVRHNLPAAASSFVGREHERVAVSALLAEARLVTLVGTGGVGKTRLALAVAADLLDHYPDGVWLAELAPLVEDRLVPQTVLETMGTREEVGRPLLVTLTEHLKDRRLLLVLDNCEHLVAACAALAEAVLRRCPGVRVLATSREGLEVTGEHRYRVPSLPIPDLAHLPPSERLAESAAVALFVARARERRGDFVLTAQNARAVAAVCAQLDGIPLAIELAAARVDSLGVEGIAARLDDRFRLLTGGPRTALPRQRTLRAALDWSYDLLGEAEQALLDRLWVFAGGCTLAAVEAVCAGEGVEDWQVLDLLDRLVSKSVVQTEEVAGEVRYGLLETVRQYGQERLAAAGRAESLRDRHLAWCVALAEDATPHLFGAEQAIYYDQLETEHDNMRVALRWAREHGAVEGLRLAGALGFFWQVCGYQGEGRGWLEGALAEGLGGGAVHAGALYWAGHLACWQGDFGRGADLIEESLALYRALDDTSGIARTLGGLADAVELQGDYAHATLLQEESLALRRALLGDRLGIAISLHHLGKVAYRRGEYERAAALFEESMALSREVGDHHGIAHSLSWLACVVERQGAYDRAVAMLEEALALCQAVGIRMTIIWSLVNLGWVLLALGEEERAMAVLEESLARSREEGHFWGVPHALHYLGWAAYRRGDYEQAAALQEQALARYRQVGYCWGIAKMLAGLGCVVQARGEYWEAATYLKEGLQLSREIGARGLLAEALEGMAWLAVAERQASRAAWLGGAAEALREALGTALHPVLRPGHDQAVQDMQAALGEAAFTAAWARGQSLPLEEAVTLALEGRVDG
jgi:predicted ATPase/class 3 adenylate cyclase/Tfp pilus assembly protein PilF